MYGACADILCLLLRKGSVFVCNDRISQNKLTGLIKFYKENGLQPRRKQSGGRIMTKRVLSYEDIERVVQFLMNFTEVNGIILPGRVAAFHRWDVKVLPSSETRSSVWRKYKSAMTASGLYWQAQRIIIYIQ